MTRPRHVIFAPRPRSIRPLVPDWLILIVALFSVAIAAAAITWLVWVDIEKLISAHQSTKALLNPIRLPGRAEPISVMLP